MSGTKRDWTRTLGAALSLVLLAGAPAAMGQDKADKPAPPLQGPKVTANRPPELEDEFAPGKGGDKFSRREPPIPIRAYAQAVNKLKGEDAPKELRLTPEQDRKIQGVMDEFRTAVQDAQRKSREMDQSPPADGKPGDAKPGDEMDKEKTDARPRRKPSAGEGAPPRERIQELRRTGPHPQEYETRIWNILSEGQQKFVKADLDTLREEQRKRQGEEYMKRELEKRRAKDGKDAGGNDAAPKRPLAGNPDGPGPSPEMRERVQRIFERMRQLSPEEREQVLQKLEQELDRRSGSDGKPGEDPAPLPRKKKTPLDKPGKGGLQGERPGDSELPAPGMDGVRVPRPDQKKP